MKTIRTTRVLLVAALFTISFQPTARAHYHPGLQRWINRDPIHEPGFLSIQQYKFTWRPELEVNVFAFVPNNPVSFIDPYGLQQAGPVQCARKRIHQECNSPGGGTPSTEDCQIVCIYLYNKAPDDRITRECMDDCERCTGVFRPRPRPTAPPPPKPAPAPSPTPSPKR
jgi:RHS repeat-associated protein